MKPLGGPLGQRWGCLRWACAGRVCVALLVASAGCSPPFSTGTGASSTGGGGAGSTTTSTSGTSTGTGGSPGCTAGACASGEYCNPETHACESCLTSTRFSFGTPSVVPLTLPMGGASALYPRVDGPITLNLYLVQQAQAAPHLNQIATAQPDAGKPIPWTMATATLVSQLKGNNQDSGPFPLQDPSQLEGLVVNAISKLGMPVLLFDSDRAGGRHVFAIGLQQVDPTQLTLPGGASDESRISVATAASPPRFFWISNTGASATEHLVTTTAAGNDAIPVSITLATACVTPLPDTPWVTPSGERLLFSSPEYVGSPCSAPSATVTHLYQVAIDGTGQPTGMAQRVFPNDGSTDTNPALTPDHCELLFSRVDPSGVEIYAAPRN
jgi:hypothetical protein